MKKYPKMKPSGVEWIGEVPEDWGNYSLKRLVGIKITDGPHETPEFVENGVPFISAESVKNSKIDFDFKRGFITKEQDIIYSKKCKPKKHDIFIVKSGSTTGKIAIVDTEEDFNIWSPLALVRSNPKLVFPNFLFYAFICDYFQRQIQLFWSFGTQPNIGMGVIESLRVILPPLPEQLTIAHYLDRKTAQIDQSIAEKERLIELFREERQAIINHAVTKGIRAGVKMKSSGVEWIGDVPEGWEVKKLKYLLKETDGAIRTGPFGSQLKSSELDDNGSYKVYNQRSVLDNDFESGSDFISNEKFEALKAFEIFPNDILITTRGTIGRCTIFPKNVQRGVLHPCLIRVQVNEEKVLKEWVANYCNGTTYFLDNVLLVSNSTTIDVIYGYTLKEVFFPVPSIQEQSEILTYLDQKTAQIDTAISGIRQEITLLLEYRQALIFEAVTGKVDVREHAQN